MEQDDRPAVWRPFIEVVSPEGTTVLIGELGIVRREPESG
jgi:hypothetical protein